MLIGPALQNGSSGGGGSGDVTIPTGSFTNSGTLPPYNQIYSGVKFSSDGNVYKMQANGGWSNIGAWLLAGSASTYYLARTLVSGSLDNDDGTDVQLNADRTYWIQDTNTDGFPETATVRFSITNSGGGSVYAGPQNFNFSANITEYGSEEP